MTAAKPEKRRLLLHLEPSLIQRSKILAVKQGTTASAVVRQALAELIERTTSERKHLAAAREGRRE
jgi:hypothetical protein